MTKHEFTPPKVTEIVRVLPQIEHDPFIDDLQASITPELPAKLAEVIDLSANVVQVDFGNHGKAA